MKIKVSAVNYLNSKPFIYGLQHSPIFSEIDLQLDIPSVCADKVINGAVDVGLVPVTVLLELPAVQIISDYCIGSKGKVDSVLLLSQVPVSDIQTVMLDYQSRTSIMLAKILFEKWWKLNPVYIDTEKDFENNISSSTAAVIIGDRAMNLRSKFEYFYDLSEEWNKYTHLPFVFACWVTNKELPAEFLAGFNAALTFGIQNKLIVAKKEQSSFPGVDVIEYLSRKISYSLDEQKKKGLEKFLSFAEKLIEKDVV